MGTLIQLEHRVKLDDLKCSEELWKKSCLNPKVDPQTLPLPHTCGDIELLHPEVEHPSGLMRHERFNAWKFHYDLFHYGPQYFRQFRKDLGEPEAVEKIPVVKMRQAPAQSMDISQSTVAGNLSAVPDLMKQGGVSGQKEEEKKSGGIWETNIVDIQKFVVIFFGDLGTFKQVQSLLLCHALMLCGTFLSVPKMPNRIKTA